MQLEGLVADGLGRGDHLAEREQHLDQGGRVDVDLLGEVGQRGATRETYGLAVALADAHATDRRGLHGLELHTTRALGLASSTRRAAGAPEGTLGLATLAGTTAAGTTAAVGAEAAGTTGSATGGTAREHRRDDPGHRRGRGHRTPGPPGPPPGPPRAGRAPGPLPKAAGDLGIIAGLGRGMPGRASPPAAGGRGGRVSSLLGVRGAGREPMPWLGANGLLPGRGAPGRPTGRGAGDGALAAGAGAAGASGSAGGASGSATGALGPGLGPGRAARGGLLDGGRGRSLGAAPRRVPRRRQACSGRAWGRASARPSWPAPRSRCRRRERRPQRPSARRRTAS